MEARCGRRDWIPTHHDGNPVSALLQFCRTRWVGWSNGRVVSVDRWLPTLKEAGFQAVLSGHKHRDRLDDANDNMPVLQFVGGGPKPEQATLTIVDSKQSDRLAELEIRIVDLNGNVLHRKQ